VTKARRRFYRSPLFFLGIWAALNLGLFYPEIKQAIVHYQTVWRGERDVRPYQIRFQPMIGRFSIPSDSFEGVDEALPYLFFEPPVSDKTERLPLLVLLHGAGDRMDVVSKQNRLLKDYFTKDEFQSKHPCYLLGPVCPTVTNWGGRQNPAISDTVIEIIQECLNTYPIDEARIYLAGHSMGAYGCFEWLAKYPDTFAAAMPVAGGGNPNDAQAMAKTPMWVIHGDADDRILPQQSIEMVEAIRAAGGTAKLTLIEGIGHDSWKHLMLHPNGELGWLFSQSRVQNDHK